MLISPIILIFIFIAIISIITFLIYKNFELKKIYKLSVENNKIYEGEIYLLKNREIMIQENYRNLEKKNEILVTELNDLGKNYEIFKYKNNELQNQLNNWQNFKDEAIKAANAALFDVGAKLSEKLAAQNEHQIQKNNEESHNNFEKYTNKVQEQFLRISEIVAILKEQVASSNNVVMQVKNSLLNPASIGALSEMILENIFKNSGLTRDRDYLIQPSFTNEEAIRFRPDALIFMPGNNYIIIDSKASSYFIEYDRYKDESEKKKFFLKIKELINIQLKNLSDKNYREIIEESFKKAGKLMKLSVTIMFLPSDHAFEIIRQADNDFLDKAWQLGIIPIGPSGLLNILMHTKFAINNEIQQKNYDQIIYEVRKLIDSLNVIGNHTMKLGGSLKNSVIHYDKFLASFNKNLVLRAINLNRLGVEGAKINRLNKELIENIETEKYDLEEIE